MCMFSHGTLTSISVSCTRLVHSVLPILICLGISLILLWKIFARTFHSDCSKFLCKFSKTNFLLFPILLLYELKDMII